MTPIDELRQIDMKRARDLRNTHAPGSTKIQRNHIDITPYELIRHPQLVDNVVN